MKIMFLVFAFFWTVGILLKLITHSLLIFFHFFLWRSRFDNIYIVAFSSVRKVNTLKFVSSDAENTLLHSRRLFKNYEIRNIAKKWMRHKQRLNLARISNAPFQWNSGCIALRSSGLLHVLEQGLCLFVNESTESLNNDKLRVFLMEARCKSLQLMTWQKHRTSSLHFHGPKSSPYEIRGKLVKELRSTHPRMQSLTGESWCWWKQTSNGTVVCCQSSCLSDVDNCTSVHLPKPTFNVISDLPGQQQKLVVSQTKQII